MPGYAQKQDDTLLVPLPRFLSSSVRAAVRQRNRQTPLVFDKPYQQDVRIHLIFPEGSAVKGVPKFVESSSAGSKFYATGRVEGNEVWYVGRLTVLDPWTADGALERSLGTLAEALQSEDSILRVELPEETASPEA